MLRLGQVETFGQHLGTDQDVDVAAFDGFVVLLKALRPGIIGVETGNPGTGKQPLYFIDDGLGASGLEDDIRVAAGRAAGRALLRGNCSCGSAVRGGRRGRSAVRRSADRWPASRSFRTSLVAPCRAGSGKAGFVRRAPGQLRWP